MIRKSKKIHEAFSQVTGELDEHLDSINANTQELLENRAMILEMQERLCKLSDQITQIKCSLETTTQDIRNIHLTMREKEVFLALYMAPDLLTFGDVAKALQLPVSLVVELIDSMLAKGLPILKNMNERGLVFLSIEQEFSELQSKENILGIDKNFSAQVSKDIQISLFD